MTNGTVPMEWIEEKPQKVWEFLEKQRPYWPPGENEKSGVTITNATNQVKPMQPSPKNFSVLLGKGIRTKNVFFVQRCLKKTASIA